MEEQETIKKTKLFGLNTYEARIWTALLSRGISTAGELSDMANVPRSRSYDVLESLENKGFVVMKLGKPIKYIAIPPQEVLENIKERIGEKAEKHLLKIKSDSFNNLINTFQEIYDRNTDIKENIVAVLRGRKNINKHLSFLFKSVGKGVLSSTGGGVEKQLGIIDQTKNPNKNLRVCVVDEDNSIIFPTQKGETHPDYELCVWIRDRQTTKFLKLLLTNN
jgi:predicted transcriptional regulator